MTLYRYRERSGGELFPANDRPSTLPPDAVGALGLDDSVRGFPMSGSAVSADQLRTAYNAQKLVSAGTDGTGQTVAIFAEGGFSQARPHAFLVPPVSVVLATNARRYITGLVDFREGRTDDWIGVFADATAAASRGGHATAGPDR